MPTYDYECRACGHRFEEMQSFSEPTLTKCPACKKNKLDRLFGGGGAIIFKGSGFYETDYRRAGDGKVDQKDKPTDGDAGGKTENKSETKSDSGGPAAASESTPSAASAKSDASKSESVKPSTKKAK